MKLAAFAATLVMAGATAALAQAYPTKPITLVIPFAAGSGTDNVGRIVTQRLAERFKQPKVLVVYSPPYEERPERVVR